MPEDPSPFAFSRISPPGMELGDAQSAPNIESGDIPPELKKALDGMRDFQSRAMVANKAAENPIAGVSEMKINNQTGEMSAKFHKDTFEALMRDHQELNQIRGSFHQEAERLKAQEARVRNQSPWITLATTLSANMAQQKNMPGWVQATGRTAAQLNPSADEIRNQRLGVMGEEAKLAERDMGFEMQREQMDREAGKEQRLAETAHATQSAKAFHELSVAAQKGELTDASLTSQVLQDAGHPKDHADAQAKLLVGVSKEKKSLIDAAAAATDKKTQDALTARAVESDKRMGVMLRGLALKTSSQSDSDKAIETTAQSIAAGDLSSIKDISSFRGSERTRIYARAKEINPNFSVAETKRKIDMEQSFTVGKDGQGLQSFGTFLEHAGELSDTLNGLYQSGSPALNKPMNWIRKNAEGNPEYQRLLVAIEPVGKEFESFLLNQRALYIDDRRQIETFLNGNSSPAQIKSALSQMGKTAKDRYTEMNHRYKRVMGQDIENPFGEEAVAGAAKVGVDLGSKSGPAAGAKDSGGPRQKVTGNDGVAEAKAAKIGDTLTIMGKRYKKRGENDFVEVK